MSGPLVGRSSRRFAGVSISVIKEKLAKGLETEVVSVQDTSGGACTIRLRLEIIMLCFFKQIFVATARFSRQVAAIFSQS